MITIYLYRTSEAFRKVLEYYKKLGVVEFYDITVPGQLIPFPRFIYKTEKLVEGRQLEAAAYHDCLYRNLFKFKYISLIDIDEVIVPTDTHTWHDMFEKIAAKKDPALNYTDYRAQQVRFYYDFNLDDSAVADIPEYTPMLSHITRGDWMDVGDSPKGFFDTQYIRYAHNHWPLECIYGCQKYQMQNNVSRLNHYRTHFNTEKSKGPFVVDKTIWKYKTALIFNTKQALKAMGLRE